ncbi:hypothetical protein L0128_03735 [candidate division KSB1 bacterium]|nr:hypothetical protein [candidate division KSB1 bacterium]
MAKIYAITPKNFVILAKILKANFGGGFAALEIIRAKNSIIFRQNNLEAE